MWRSVARSLGLRGFARGGAKSEGDDFAALIAIRDGRRTTVIALRAGAFRKGVEAAMEIEARVYGSLPDGESSGHGDLGGDVAVRAVEPENLVGRGREILDHKIVMTLSV